MTRAWKFVAGRRGRTGRMGRMTRGVAGVEVDFKFVGWVSQFPEGWRFKPDNGEYADGVYRSRKEAGEALVESLQTQEGAA